MIRALIRVKKYPQRSEEIIVKEFENETAAFEYCKFWSDNYDSYTYLGIEGKIAEKSPKMKVFLDMDGVLADMEGYCLEVFNKPYELIDKEYFWSTVPHNMFEELPLLPDADNLVENVMDLSKEYVFEVHILTALPPESFAFPSAADDKLKWVINNYIHYGDLYENFHTGPYSKDKYKYCSPNDVLIDDNPRNITQWFHAGGLGILHKSGNTKNSIKALKEHLYQMSLKDE